jgi:Caspase domain/TIR domain
MSKKQNDKDKQASQQKQQQIPQKSIPLDPKLIHTVKKGEDEIGDTTKQVIDEVHSHPSTQKSQTQRMENAHALIIGIAEYQHIASLPETVKNDATDIYNLLTDPQHCGYLPENVDLLLNAKATGEAVHQALIDLTARTNHDSVIFIYISSHGGRIPSGDYKGEYLFPTNVVAENDQSIAESAISGTELSTALSAISARKMVVIFDCCHAGGLSYMKDSNRVTFEKGLPDSYYQSLQTGRGRVIIASSRDTEHSHIFSGDRNSLFTKHLLAGLRGRVLSDDGLVHIFNLFEYLQPLVTGEEAQQHPVFKSDLEENFPIAFYIGGRKGKIPVDEEGFLYDAYISYVDQEPDATWVWETLVPRLEEVHLRIAVSADAEDPGVARVVGIERGIKQSRRTLVVLSPSYLADHLAAFENTLGQTLGIQEGTYRLLPVKIAQIDEKQLPLRLSMLNMVDLTHPNRSIREFDRLMRALQGPLPHQ